MVWGIIPAQESKRMKWQVHIENIRIMCSSKIREHEDSCL